MLRVFAIILICHSFASLGFGGSGMEKIKSLNEFRIHHRNLVKAIILLESNNKYSTLKPMEGQFSFHPTFEEKITEFFSLNSYADNMELCFFGGWPTYRERGYCRVPWNYSMGNRFGISYDRDHYCRNRNMFRCNPTLFGPGDGSVSNERNGAGLNAGACVSFNTGGNRLQDVTRLCYERSQGNIDAIYELYQNDEEYRERYHQMAAEVTSFCQENSDYSACEYLLSRIVSINEKICEGMADDSLDIGGDAVDTIEEVEEAVTRTLPPQFSLIPGVRLVSEDEEVERRPLPEIETPEVETEEVEVAEGPELTEEVEEEEEVVVVPEDIEETEEEEVATTTVERSPGNLPANISLAPGIRLVSESERVDRAPLPDMTPEVEDGPEIILSTKSPSDAVMHVSELAPEESPIPPRRPDNLVPENDITLVAGDGEVDISSFPNLRSGCQGIGTCGQTNNRNYFDDNRAMSDTAFNRIGGCEQNISCPQGMALVCSSEYNTKVCMDVNLEMMDDGVTPQGNYSYDSCVAYCDSRDTAELDFRIPTNNEWLVGSLGTQSNNCLPDSVDRRPDWNSSREMQDLDFNRTGIRQDRSSCVSAYGIRDMVGVLGQHVSDGHAASNRIQFNGGLWPQGVSSTMYRTVAHNRGYSDYSTGCRCAVEARRGSVTSPAPDAVERPEPEEEEEQVEEADLTLTSGASELAPDRSPIPLPRPRPDESPIPIPSPRPVDGTPGQDLPAAEASVEGVRAACQVEGTSERWRRNCEQLYSTNVPDGALNYALEVMRLNATSFRTNRCFRPDEQRPNGGLKPSGHPSMMELTDDQFENNLMANGLPNKCQIVINDAGDRLSGYDCRARMYYIDLCQNTHPVVEETYFNLGTGTCRRGHGYTNGSGIGTTVLGAFFTHNQNFDFQDTTTQRDAYAGVAREVEAAGGDREATAVNLFGLQNSNNLSSRTGKYMHVSPWVSSLGCPSTAPENYYMIEALAENGPSLLLNYHEGQMEDISQCTE